MTSRDYLDRLGATARSCNWEPGAFRTACVARLEEAIAAGRLPAEVPDEALERVSRMLAGHTGRARTNGAVA